jgi:hypothetical protein
MFKVVPVNSRVAPCVSQHPRLPPVSFYRNRGPNQRPGVQPGSHLHKESRTSVFLPHTRLSGAPLAGLLPVVM